MKSILKVNLILVLILSSASAQSFTDKGTVEIGGGITFSSISAGGYQNSSYSVFTFNPYFGGMVTRGLELGITPGFSGVDGAKKFDIFFAPSYNISTSTNVYPYFEFLIGYNSITDEGVSTSGGLGIGGDAGIKVAISTSALLVFVIQYLNQSYNFGQQTYSYYNQVELHNYTLNVFTLGVGFSYYLPAITK